MGIITRGKNGRGKRGNRREAHRKVVGALGKTGE
jgi:hypothetical protein